MVDDAGLEKFETVGQKAHFRSQEKKRQVDRPALLRAVKALAFNDHHEQGDADFVKWQELVEASKGKGVSNDLKDFATLLVREGLQVADTYDSRFRLRKLEGLVEPRKNISKTLAWVWKNEDGKTDWKQVVNDLDSSLRTGSNMAKRGITDSGVSSRLGFEELTAITEALRSGKEIPPRKVPQ